MTWITANFPDLPQATKNKISAFTTTRVGGSSRGEYTSFNLATHVNDELEIVYSNRGLLRETANVPSEPYWLNQTHSNNVIEVPYEYRGYTDGNIIAIIEADASYTSLEDHVCAVMTADCLPLLMVDESANTVAAIHAGWRGLANGIISSTIEKLKVDGRKLHVWLGPAIGPKAFEVGEEVKDIFVSLSAINESCFLPQGFSSQTTHHQKNSNKYLCDMYQLARNQLHALGVTHISGGEYCTFHDKEFFSYRRDGQTGRMASVIWLNK